MKSSDVEISKAHKMGFLFVFLTFSSIQFYFFVNIFSLYYYYCNSVYSIIYCCHLWAILYAGWKECNSTGNSEKRINFVKT